MTATPRDVLPILALAVALAALLMPTPWLTGELGPDDPRLLQVGALIWRGSLLIAGLMLLLGARLPAGRAAPPRGNRVWPLALAVLAVAAALRILKLGAPLWFDEIWMLLDTVRIPIGESVRTYASDNDHPLYSFLASVSVRVFGESAFSLRLPAAAFGVGSIWALWLFARDRVRPAVTLVSMAILAVAFHHVWFSQNARGYTGLLFFTILSSHLLLNALETGRARDWLGYAVALALNVHVHMTGVFIASGHLAILLVAFVTKRNRAGGGGRAAGALGLALAGVLSIHLYSLVLPQVFAFFTNRPPAPAADARWTDPLWTVLETARSFGFGVGPGLVVLAGAALLAVLGLRSIARDAPAVPLLLLVPAVSVAVPLLVLGRNLWPRFFFFLAGFGVLTAVSGTFALVRMATKWRFPDRPRWLEPAAGAVLVLLAAGLLPRAYRVPKQDYPAAREWTESRAEAGEAIGTTGLATMPYERYYRAGFTPLETAEDLGDLFPTGSGKTGYVIFTFPIYMESRQPGLLAALLERGREVARFPGSVGGGDLVVLWISDN